MPDNKKSLPPPQKKKKKLWVLPLLMVRLCSKPSSYVISRKTNEPSLRKNDKKPNFRPDFGPFGPNLGLKNLFCDFAFTSS